MDDTQNLNLPKRLKDIEEDTQSHGFSMASDHQTGSFLRTLVASRPGGQILELGTGTGLGACWLLDGMDSQSHLTTVDDDAEVVEIAKKHLSLDGRITFHVKDGSEFLKGAQKDSFDLIFADTWPGKYWDRELTFDLLKKGGIYIVDDMLPQENWPEEHFPKAKELVQILENQKGFKKTKLNWSTGIIILVKE